MSTFRHSSSTLLRNRSAWNFLTFCLALFFAGGTSAQDGALVRGAEYKCVSPKGNYTIAQYHNTDENWTWESWISRLGQPKAWKLPTASKDYPGYGSSFYFHPKEQWLMRTQKTGSGDNVAVLYKVTRDGRFTPHHGEATFDEIAWKEFDRRQGFTGKETERFHTWCEFLGWEADGETLRVRLSGTHCYEDYHVKWSMHYHVLSGKFFLAKDDVAFNAEQGVVWKKRVARRTP